jgi:hypothetical protein
MFYRLVINPPVLAGFVDKLRPCAKNEWNFMSEFIYVLENALMPGLVKIGRTERSVSERVGELSSHTGVPISFTVIKEYAVENSGEAEKIIHERLSDFRVNDNREFFKIDVDDAMEIIESLLPKTEMRRDYDREDEIVDIIIPEKLSYIVVFIENLEQLLQAAPVDTERTIARITQMARPAGIHLVLTTKTISKDMLSENTLAEIPARIAFRCRSRIESRSIIGVAGAEKLFGNGEMLYLPPGSANLNRAQGALVTDHEVQATVDFIAMQGKPSYDITIYRQLSKSTNIESGIDEDEELVQQCIEVIRNEQKASVPLLQRRLRLGYTRAARIMDELEGRGIVGPSKGTEPRDILIDLDGDGANDDFYSDAPIPLVEQPPAIQPHLVVCLCEHCAEKIEFDANELGDRQSVSVPCPHCGVETVLSPLP